MVEPTVVTRFWVYDPDTYLLDRPPSVPRRQVPEFIPLTRPDPNQRVSDTDV